jgi:hypothetical protein
MSRVTLDLEVTAGGFALWLVVITRTRGTSILMRLDSPTGYAFAELLLSLPDKGVANRDPLHAGGQDGLRVVGFCAEPYRRGGG